MVTRETGLTKCTMGLFWGAPASFLGVLQGFVGISRQAIQCVGKVRLFDNTLCQSHLNIYSCKRFVNALKMVFLN